MNLAAVGSSKNLGSGSSSSGKSLWKMRTRVGASVAVFDEAFEEGADEAEPMTDGMVDAVLPPGRTEASQNL